MKLILRCIVFVRAFSYEYSFTGEEGLVSAVVNQNLLRNLSKTWTSTNILYYYEHMFSSV